MPRLGESRLELFGSLDSRYGTLPPPGGTSSVVEGAEPFEAITRVALGLVAEPRAAASALEALRESGLLDPKALGAADPLELDEVFRRARVRLLAKDLKPLRRIARWAAEGGHDAEGLAGLSTEAIREAWRDLNGVGPATADAILVFALGRATLPVDRASYRILVRHGWLDPSGDYEEARSVLEGIAPDDPGALARLSLGLARIGRDACKPATPRCERCPLAGLLPDGGPVATDG